MTYDMSSKASIMALLASFTPAPFLMSAELAIETDATIGSHVCGLDKSRYSRLYWYDYMPQASGFSVNIMRVRFALIDDGKPVVQHTTTLPLKYQESEDLVALGVFELVDEEIAEIRCFR